MDVCIPRPAEGDFLGQLRALLDPGVRVVDGACHVLVEGVPTREQLEASPELRAVLIPYAGVPRKTRELVADFPAVTLHNLHHNATPTAEMTVALLLATAKRVVPFDQALRRGDWRPRYAEADHFLCHGKTAVILGFGAIGTRVGRALEALGMNVVGVRRGDTFDLRKANALVVCLPWTSETDGLLGKDELALLPDGAILVNVARGPVIDERALYDELRSGRIAAGLDVWYAYPKDEKARADTQPSEFPFHELDNVVLSPHRGGGMTPEVERMRATDVAAMLNAAARGETMGNRVDLERGY